MLLGNLLTDTQAVLLLAFVRFLWVRCKSALNKEEINKINGIRRRSLVYKEVVEAISNYKKSYFWWFENPACGDSTGSNRIEKDQAHVSPRLAWRKVEKEQYDLVCVERL